MDTIHTLHTQYNTIQYNTHTHISYHNRSLSNLVLCIPLSLSVYLYISICQEVYPRTMEQRRVCNSTENFVMRCCLCAVYI